MSIKEFAMVYGGRLGGRFAVLLFVVLLALGCNNAARANHIFVINQGDPRAPEPRGSVGEYTTAGATVNPTLISGLNRPQGIAVSGSDLFVVNEANGTIGKYTTAGATVNASLISGLNGPQGIAVSGSDLFVVNEANGTIGKYTTAGATVNPALISGLSSPTYLAVATVPAPEPTNLILILLGLVLAGLGLNGWRKRSS
jgi:DNA-binding beta-propeller fold protein YncE